MSHDFENAWGKISRGCSYIEQSGVGWFSLPAFSAAGFVQHGLTARIGGVSQGGYASLNLSFTRPDEPRENVMENHRIFAKAAGIPWDSMVMDRFEHGTTVLQVDRSNKGMGYLRPSLPSCDGLITDDPAITLITGHADCLPLFFADPVRRCIGLAHAGWKGTLGKIGWHTIRMMQERFGSDPMNILAGVGPCICQDCFEVDADLGQQFADTFTGVPCVAPGKPGKAQVDLPMAAAAQFLEAGVLPEHISLSGICTFEEPERLYSHRRDQGNTGGMAAFLSLSGCN